MEHRISKNRLTLKRYLVFFIFITLTLIFWLMNKLAQNYVTVLQLAPEIKSSSIIYSATIDNTLYVQVNASGFFILRKKFSQKDVFFIEPENFTNKSILKIATNSLKENIKEHFDKRVQITSIEPDTIFFKISEQISKKVPVTGNFNLSFKDEFRQSAPVNFFPDSVIVTGSKQDVEKIKKISLPFKKYDYPDNTIEDILTLSPHSNIFVSHSKIRYKIPIERCTEGTVSVPVKIANLPKTNNLILLPAKVNIKYTAPVKNYKSVSNDDFAVEVDYDETANSLNRQIVVKVVRKPDFAFNLTVEPRFVEFLIQK